MVNRKKTIAEVEQELYETQQRQTMRKLKKTPNPIEYQKIPFIKHGIKVIAYAFGLFGFFELGFFGLLLAEVVGIYEELV